MKKENEIIRATGESVETDAAVSRAEFEARLDKIVEEYEKSVDEARETLLEMVEEFYEYKKQAAINEMTVNAAQDPHFPGADDLTDFYDSVIAIEDERKADVDKVFEAMSTTMFAMPLLQLAQSMLSTLEGSNNNGTEAQK